MNYLFTLLCLLFVSGHILSVAGQPTSKKNNSQPSDRVKRQIYADLKLYAQKSNVTINTSKVEFATLKSTLIASVPIASTEQLKKADFSKGVDLEIVYFSEPMPRKNQPVIPSGYYIARLVGNPKYPGAKSQLVSNGVVIAESEVCTTCHTATRASITLPVPSTSEGYASVSNSRIITPAGRESQLISTTSVNRLQREGFTRCHGFLLFCARERFSAGFSEVVWEWCGFCFGIW